jgi:hypothetical protein
VPGLWDEDGTVSWFAGLPVCRSLCLTEGGEQVGNQICYTNHNKSPHRKNLLYLLFLRDANGWDIIPTEEDLSHGVPLYPATVGLFCQVLKVLVLLGLGQQMSARCVQLVCLYVCGLIAAAGIWSPMGNAQ